MSPRVAIAPTVFSFARIVCKLHIHPYLDHELPVGCSAFISVWSNIVLHLHHGVRHLSKWNEKKLEQPMLTLMLRQVLSLITDSRSQIIIAGKIKDTQTMFFLEALSVCPSEIIQF